MLQQAVDISSMVGFELLELVSSAIIVEELLYTAGFGGIAL